MVGCPAFRWRQHANAFGKLNQFETLLRYIKERSCWLPCALGTVVWHCYLTDRLKLPILSWEKFRLRWVTVKRLYERIQEEKKRPIADDREVHRHWYDWICCHHVFFVAMPKKGNLVQCLRTTVLLYVSVRRRVSNKGWQVPSLLLGVCWARWEYAEYGGIKLECYSWAVICTHSAWKQHFKIFSGADGWKYRIETELWYGWLAPKWSTVLVCCGLDNAYSCYATGMILWLAYFSVLLSVDGLLHVQQ